MAARRPRVGPHAVLAAVLVAAVVLFNAVVLLPEVTVPVPSNNDDAFQLLYVRRAAEALASGENPLDFWTPQLELGFATFVHYQNLPHLAVVLLDRALFGAVDLLTLFNVVRYLLMVSFPLAVLWSLRRVGLGWPAAVFAAAAAPLLATPFLYGFDYGSYTWRGFGTYTQLWAMPLSFIGIAATHTVITRGRGHLLAIVALSALVLSHLLYAYIVAASIGVLFLVLLRRATWRTQVRDLAIVGVATLAVTSYMWVPFIRYGAFLNVSPYLQREKYDGFGAQRVLELLVTGQLFDAGRLPALTVLLAVGAVSALVVRTRARLAWLVLFVLWVVLYFGRPTFGGLYDLLPLSQTLLIHRFSGAVQLFGIVLIGMGAGWLWDLAAAGAPRLQRPLRSAVPYALAGAAALALVPAMAERAAFDGQGAAWMRATAAALAADADARTIVATLRTLPPGRVFAGLRTDYGPRMDFGIPFNSVRFSDLLVFESFDVVAPPYNSSSLSSDMLWDFDYRRLEDYDLFNVRYAVAPASLPMEASLRPILRTGRYTLYEAPTSGYSEYVRVGERRAAASPAVLIAANRPWLLAPDRADRGFIQWDYPAPVPRGGADTAPSCANGATRDLRVEPARIDVTASCDGAGTLLLKVTYDPGWRVTIDGAAAETLMLSPAYLAVRIPPGTHTVSARYEPVAEKTPLFVLGALVLAAAVPLSRRYAPR